MRRIPADQDYEMEGTDDHRTTSFPSEPMQLSDEQADGAKHSSFKRRFNKFTSTAPLFSGTRSGVRKPSATGASEARPRGRSHDRARSYSEHCESCIAPGDTEKRIEEESDRLVKGYEELLKKEKDTFQQEFQASTTEIDNLKKENDRLEAIISEYTAIDDNKEQIEKLNEDCRNKTERIDILENELAANKVHVKDLKTEIFTSREYIDSIKVRFEKCHQQNEELKHDREMYYTQLQTLKSESKGMAQAIEKLRSDIAARDNDIRGLKLEISKSRPGNSALVPDNKIVTDYQYLLSQLTNWTLSNFRKLEPMNLEQAIADLGVDSGICEAIVDCLKENPGRKCLVINMLVMLLIKKHVFRPLLFGLEESEDMYLDRLYDSLFKQNAEKEVNFWRSTTLRMIIASEVHKKKVNSSIDEVTSVLESFLDRIFPPSPSSLISNHRVEVLKTIITHAAELALTLCVQRPSYRLAVPVIGKAFMKNFMDSAELDNDDESEGGGGIIETLKSVTGRKKHEEYIKLVIFPLLAKSGTEDGDHYDKEVIIHKGKVLKA